MGWNKLVERLPEGVWIPLYARLRRREGWGDWRLVGELRRGAARVDANIGERSAVFAPAWAALAANDNARPDDGHGLLLQFAACVSGRDALVLGEVRPVGSLLGAMRDVGDAQRAPYRRGLKGSAHHGLASNWPDASRLAPRGTKKEDEVMPG